MSKHTPEPWVFESEPKYCSEIFGSNCEPICTFLDEPSAVDVDRILSCVNACAGMEDPAAEIAELKGLVAVVGNQLMAADERSEGQEREIRKLARTAADAENKLADALNQRDELLAVLNYARDYLGDIPARGVVLLGLISVMNKNIDEAKGGAS